MFLALDAGNTAVKAGLHDGARWAALARWPSHALAEASATSSSEGPAGLEASAEAWAERLGLFVSTHAPGGVSAAGLASVVPALARPLALAVEGVAGLAPVTVQASMRLPFRMAYATPGTLGADRLASAAAAHLLYGRGLDEGSQGSFRPVIALDAGTALTLEVVDAEPAFLGGAIAPGPDLLRKALAGGTAQLPDVPWLLPPSSIGATTAEAMQAGLTALFLDGLRGLLRRTAESLGAEPFVVATGGWAPWIAGHLCSAETPVSVVAPHLVLDGIRLLSLGDFPDRSEASED